MNAIHIPGLVVGRSGAIRKRHGAIFSGERRAGIVFATAHKNCSGELSTN